MSFDFVFSFRMYVCALWASADAMTKSHIHRFQSLYRHYHFIRPDNLWFETKIKLLTHQIVIRRINEKKKTNLLVLTIFSIKHSA